MITDDEVDANQSIGRRPACHPRGARWRALRTQRAEVCVRSALVGHLLQARRGWFVQVMVQQCLVWTGVAIAPVCEADSVLNFSAGVQWTETMTAAA